MARAPQMRDALLAALKLVTPAQAEACGILEALGHCTTPSPVTPTLVVVIDDVPHVVSTTQKGQALMLQKGKTSGWVHECVVDASLKKPEGAV
jgi:hypothetical protein